MNELVFFLEEESAKALLEQIFPHLMPSGGQVHPRFIVFEGKQDLEKQLPNKLRGIREHALLSCGIRTRLIAGRSRDRSSLFAPVLAVPKPPCVSRAANWRHSTLATCSLSKKGWISAALLASRIRQDFATPIRWSVRPTSYEN